MPGQFHLSGPVRQLVKDGVDAANTLDLAAVGGWTARLMSNVPIKQPVRDGAGGVMYVDERRVIVLEDGQISEDGVNPGATLSGIRYAVVYDDTPATDATKPLILYVDYGTDQAVTAGTFSINWDALGIATLTAA